MNNLFYLIISCFLVLPNARAQEWEWGNNFSFPGVEANAVIGGSDENGNLFCAVRSVESSAHLYKAQYNLLKINSQGELLWSKEITEYTRASMVTDISGNTYLAFNDRMAKIDSDGNYVWQHSTNGQRFFGQIFLKYDSLLVTGIESDKQTFIAKYDLAGVHISSVHGYEYKIAAKYTLDASQNLFQLTSDYPDSINGNKGRLSKYSPTGTLIFKKSVPYEPKDIITDKEGNVYIAGYFSWGMVNDFDGVKISKPRIDNDYTYWHYLIKYDPEGQLIWYKILKGGSSSNISLQIDDHNNLVYASNIYGESSLNDVQINNIGGALLIVKINPAGEIVWHEKIKDGPSFENLYLDRQNQVYVSGHFRGSFTLGSSIVGPTAQDLYAEMFVAKLSQTGTVDLKENVESENLWTIYPNPSGDIFSLHGETDKAIDFSVTNTQGQLILSGSFKGFNQNIDLSAFAPGVYLLQIKSGESIETRKLVKN